MIFQKFKASWLLKKHKMKFYLKKMKNYFQKSKNLNLKNSLKNSFKSTLKN